MNADSKNKNDKLINQAVIRQLIDFMSKNKYFTFGDLIRELGLSYQEGIKYVLELQKKEIIVKTKISSYYTLGNNYRKLK
jgi:predicted transcriptional regulator